MASINIQICLTHTSRLQQIAHTLSSATADRSLCSMLCGNAAVEAGYPVCHMQECNVPLKLLFEFLMVKKKPNF